MQMPPQLTAVEPKAHTTFTQSWSKMASGCQIRIYTCESSLIVDVVMHAPRCYSSLDVAVFSLSHTHTHTHTHTHAQARTHAHRMGAYAHRMDMCIRTYSMVKIPQSAADVYAPDTSSCGQKDRRPCIHRSKPVPQARHVCNPETPDIQVACFQTYSARSIWRTLTIIHMKVREIHNLKTSFGI
jgi:hypothetical protein